MIERIKEIASVLLWGLVVGACFCFLTFAGLRFFLLFKLFSIGLCLVLLLIFFILSQKSIRPFKWLTLFLRTALYSFITLSVLGLFWVFITEDFYPTSLELILWYILTPIIVFGTTFNLLIKLFWFDTKIGRALDQNSKGFRYLLGLKQN